VNTISGLYLRFPGAILILAVAPVGVLPLAAQTKTAATLSASATNVTVSQTVTLQAQVSALVQQPSLPPPTGTVTFIAGSVMLGTEGLRADGSSQLTVQFPSAGVWMVQAVYVGDTTYAGSTSQGVSITVTLATSSVSSVQASPPNPAAGQNVTLAVQVSGLAPLTKVTPTGAVAFSDNGATALGTATLDGTGAGQITVTLSSGTHVIVASYSGDANFSGSSSPPLTIVVQGALTTTTTTLSVNPSTVNVGQSVTFMASVSTTGSGGVSPTGSVTFMDGSTTLGATPLTGTSAMLSTSSLAAGTHNVTAVYSGDSNFSGSTSSAVVVTVRASAGVSLAFSEGAGGLTLTSAVTINGNVTPTGTVQFTDVTTGATLTTTALVNGSASVTLNLLPAAGDMIQASYSGDANYPSSTSATLPLVVITSGFSANFSAFAPDEFASIFGASLAATTVSASQLPLPSTLGGLMVAIVDASGAAHVALLAYVSPTQVNVIIPGDTPVGPATLLLNGPNGATFKVSITIASVSPSLAPVGQIIRVHFNGSQDLPVPTAFFDATTQSWITVAIPFGLSSTDTLYLVLYGTGFRHSHSTVTCFANGQLISPFYAGAQGTFPGLDQINLVIPPFLRAAGAVQVNCGADGQVSNPMNLIFQ
jgi:uncharacterized protein (TIGR03437 family)